MFVPEETLPLFSGSLVQFLFSDSRTQTHHARPECLSVVSDTSFVPNCGQRVCVCGPRILRRDRSYVPPTGVMARGKIMSTKVQSLESFDTLTPFRDRTRSQ